MHRLAAAIFVEGASLREQMRATGLFYCNISVSTRPEEPLGVSIDSMVASVGAMSIGETLA